MIGYVVLGTNDLARAAAFYDELLAEMGVTRQMEFGERGYAWAAAMDKPERDKRVAKVRFIVGSFAFTKGCCPCCRR